SFKVGNGKVTLNLGWQRNQRKEFGNPDDPQESNLYFDLHTVNYNTAYHFDDKNGWTTSIGVGGMVQSNQNKGIEVLIPEYNLFDLGAFIYSQKSIGKTTVSGGIRYDTRVLNSKEFMEGTQVKFSQFHKTFYNMSGSVGLSYAATESWVLKANLAHGFRAPSIPELASNGAHEGTNRYEYGNTSMNSETSLQGDIGTEWSSEHVMLNAAAFYNHMNNFIFYSKLSNGRGGDSLVAVDNILIPAYKFNQSSANLSGFEALLDIHPHPFDWLHFENTFSYVRGKFAEPVEGTNNVPAIPASRWRSELRAELLKSGKQIKNLNIYIEADRTFAQEKPFIAYGTETSTPGYTLINSGVNANIQHKNKTVFSIFVMAENLSDVAYQSHLSRLKYTDVNLSNGRRGVWNMGRNFMFKVNIPLSFDTK
ncbi:MAG: TonB-dependent receptor domain-containing protein, partial [Candidatus Dadabacteria bacterium]